jgi:hypothetical protein
MVFLRVRPWLVFTLLALAACTAKQKKAPEWLSSQDSEQTTQLVRHLRGLDIAMWEIGQRYEELAAAGERENWDYAVYQTGKIRLALELAVERRPKRAESAKMMEPALLGMEKALERRNQLSFRQAFQHLTATCNACHVAEKVGFMVVQPPEGITSLIHPSHTKATKE